MSMLVHRMGAMLLHERAAESRALVSQYAIMPGFVQTSEDTIFVSQPFFADLEATFCFTDLLCRRLSMSMHVLGQVLRPNI